MSAPKLTLATYDSADKKIEIWSGGRAVAWVDYDDVDQRVQEKLARLFVAAPSLLRACRLVERHCPADPDINTEWQAAWDALAAAIEKAS